MTPAADPSVSDSRRSSFWLLAILALLVIGIGLGLRDPWPSDEPAYALAAKQMVESGDWLFAHRGRELYTAAPPMLFWLEALSYKLTASWRAAFLLPSLLGALLTLGAVYGLGKRLWTRRVGLYAAVGLLFVFQFTADFKRGHVDTIATAFITLANWGLIVHFLRGPNWFAFWIGCFAAALGVLTTGSAILVVLMFVPYLIARWRRWPDVPATENSALKWLIGAAAFAAPLIVWTIATLVAAKSHGPEYGSYLHDVFFGKPVGAAEPAWYCAAFVFFAWMPLPIIYMAAAPAWYHDLKNGDARVVLPLMWAALFIVIVMLLPGRRDIVLLPALPMLAVAIAPYLPAFASDRWARVIGFSIALLGGFGFIGLGGWSLLNRFPAAEQFIQEHGLRDLNWIVWVMVLAMGCAMLLGALAFRIRRGASALLAAVAAVWLIWSLWAYPMLNDSSSAAAVMRRAREVAGRDAEIGLVAWKEQNLLMAQAPVRDFGFNWPWNLQYQEAVAWQAEAPLKRYVFILEEAMGACIDKSRATRVGHTAHRDWWLFKADAVVAGCAPTTLSDD